MDPQLPVSGSYEDLYAQASRHFELGETEEAQAMFERLVRRLGKLSEHSFARRPNLKELQVVCMRSLGVIYGRRGSFEQAMEMYRRLIDLTPPAEHADWQHAIARLKIRQGHLQEGLDELRALAVTHGAEAWPWLSLGLVFFETGDEQEAEVNLRRATDRLTGDSDERFLTFITLFALYKNQGRYAEAEKAWQDAWGGTKKHPPKVTALYEMYLEAGELKRAESWLRKEKNPLRRGLYKGLIARAGG
ncbi:MAG: tetratricopeptide repeat protein, partial [Anaerolineae bacterium]